MTRSIASKLAKKVANVSREASQVPSFYKPTQERNKRSKKRSHITIQAKVDDTYSFDHNTTETKTPTKRGESDGITSKTAGGDVSVTATQSKKIKWEPTSWKQQLQNIKEMRQTKDAPVDVMGCDKLGDQKADPEVITE